MIYILHISDLHFMKNAASYNTETILIQEAAERMCNVPQGQKLLVITGDFHNFWDKEYVKAEAFIKKLVSAMDLDITKDVFVVPGNHDVGNEHTLNALLAEEDPQWRIHNNASVVMLKHGEMDYLNDRLRVFRPFCRLLFQLGIYEATSCDSELPAKSHVRSWRQKLNILHLNTAIIADGKEKGNQMTDSDTAAKEDTWRSFYRQDIPALAIGHNSYYDLVESQRRELATTFALRNVSAYLCGDTHLMETNPERQMIRLESGHKQGLSIPNLVAARSIADGKDTYSEVGYCWHIWDENTDSVVVEFRKWSPENYAKTIICGEYGEYIMRKKSQKPLHEVRLIGLDRPVDDASPYPTTSRFPLPTDQVPYIVAQSKAHDDDSNCLDAIAKIQRGAEFVLLGKYPQLANGDAQPIEWQVLYKDKNRALLICKHAIDCKLYNDTKKPIMWAESTIRHWLNNDFFHTAFDDKIQRLIIPVEILSNRDPACSVETEILTKDKIFLLSVFEAETYFITDKERMCAATDYAIKNGAWTSINRTVHGRASSWWWLRSPGNDNASAASVNSNGSISNSGYKVNCDLVCVRPALWVPL